MSVPPVSSQPLVSCVMPTTSRRRAFLPQAIRYFQRQDYANKELLIVDDGAEPLAELVPDDPQVRYVRLTGKRTLGSKRNLCVEAARGDLIMHWDDDDWANSLRISYQLKALLRAGAEICGIRQMIFYELATARTWLYQYPPDQRAWLAGSSLLYTREFWRRSPFPDIQVASDTSFVWSQKMERAVALPDYSFYIAMIHPDNTSPKKCQGAYWSPWHGDIRSLMGADYPFYQTFLTTKETTKEATKETIKETTKEAPSSSRSDEPAHITKPQLEQSSAAPAEEMGEREEVRVSRQAAIEVRAADQPFSTFIHANGRKPLVSCILATGNRLAFTRQAIRCFLRQTFDDAELIVVDDGVESAAELCAGLLRVRHIRLTKPTTLGSKLNIGVEQSAGSIIQKLDDDDFYQQDFLARSVGALREAKEARAIVTWDCFTILLAGEKRVRYSGHGWTTGGTLCFQRQLWEQRPFRDEPRRVDAWFIEDHGSRLIRVCAPELYMLVRHGRNTWKRLSNDIPVDDHFKSLPLHNKALDDLVEPIDRVFYHSLMNGRAQ
jgi:glycosyltransferase involved in cell wall biosynthesis